ncbi:hypothetical protein [Pseudidiomarina terrestris]|uniref:hypothetical protein n=1 Tax=Pseudidiomarina terrestris TaxID=2820060 RepID=UPI00265660C2|nr:MULTISPECIES: hypothetical protein [unclassified Pseudidiomarina]MDN7134556.1 hypothetical protein [Pseudidiomarina sp. 1ASP75-5]MEA3587656.1 hypothetical protein [Pseudidiomarina sp. 1APP75-27a]
MNSQDSALRRTPLRPAEKMLYAGIIIAAILYAVRYFIDMSLAVSDIASTTINASLLAQVLSVGPAFISYLSSGILFLALLQYIVRELPRD